jgi:hypothetical protein
MIFSVCNALGWVLHLLVIYLTIQAASPTTTPRLTPTLTTTPTCSDSPVNYLIFLVRNCSQNFVNFSVLPLHRNHLFQFKMAVLTRSMTRQRDTDTNSTVIDLLSSSLVDTLSSTQNQLLSSSSSLLDESVIIFENQFEISNNNNLEISNLCQLCTPCHFSSQFSKMESECNDDMNVMTTDPDPPDLPSNTQEGIMKVLMAISSQMMANTQDLQEQILRNAKELQDQLNRNETKLSEELARMKHDQETFKQELRHEVSLQQQGQRSTLPVSSQVTQSLIPPISNSSTLLNGFSQSSLNTNSTLVSPSIASTTSTNSDTLQAQMLQMLNETFLSCPLFLLSLRIRPNQSGLSFQGRSQNSRTGT